MEQYWNKYYITTTREYWSLLLQVWWLLKEPLVISISLFQAYISCRSTFFVNRSLKQFMVAFLEQKNVSQHGISIPPQSCLQWRQRPVTSRVIDPPPARKYHAILEYSCGRWPTVSSPLSTLIANLLN